MTVRALGQDRAVVVSGEHLAPVAWALRVPFGPEEVVILGPLPAAAVMSALDYLRAAPTTERQAQNAGLDVDLARLTSDALYAAARAAAIQAATNTPATLATGLQQA